MRPGVALEPAPSGMCVSRHPLDHRSSRVGRNAQAGVTVGDAAQCAKGWGRSGVDQTTACGKEGAQDFRAAVTRLNIPANVKSDPGAKSDQEQGLPR